MSSSRGIGSGQAQFFATILKNMKNKPDVNWTAVAEQSGYSSAKVAQTRYGQIMKQLALENLNGVESTRSVTKQKDSSGEKKPKVGSGTNLGAMKVTKPSAKVAAKVKLEKIKQGVEVWHEKNMYEETVNIEV